MPVEETARRLDAMAQKGLNFPESISRHLAAPNTGARPPSYASYPCGRTSTLPARYWYMSEPRSWCAARPGLR
jgi:hypothetical protein